ncbi:hypothetical protein [Ralstonia holmesii]|uniref:hypothetical protein n=1 Tax=Ralstonia holmesii TaxID=3058602 RepID=UPI003D65EBD4
MRNELPIYGNYRLITFNTRVAWWVAPYLKAVVLIARATGVHPDIRKVTRRVMRGIRTTTVTRRPR